MNLPQPCCSPAATAEGIASRGGAARDLEPQRWVDPAVTTRDRPGRTISEEGPVDERLGRLARDARTTGPEGHLPLARELHRAGRLDEAAQALRVAFACPLRFEALTPTADPLVRHCARCERTVRWVATPGELVEQALQGSCVAFRPAKLTRPVRRTGVDPLRPPEHACVVQSARRYRDPSTCQFSDRLPAAVAWEHRCLAVSGGSGPLELVASSDLYPVDVQRLEDDLRFVLGIEVVAPWFAPAAAIRDALEEVYGPDPRPSESNAFMGLLA